MLVLEGIVTTLNDDASPNIAPMGPRVDAAISQIVLRPFQSSRTFRNLARSGEGVLHVTDDVELLARAAVDQLIPLPALIPAKTVAGVVLADACRWFEFRVCAIDQRDERSLIDCEVVDRGWHRDFFGFNRAKHAVVEAAILATRIDLLPAEQIEAEFQRLRPLVEKTAGEAERRAFDFLVEYVQRRGRRN
jgi:hypothetical protein